MAVQGTIVTIGGLTATDAYLRITQLTIQKIIGEVSSDNGKWQMVYGVNCYLNEESRASAPRTILSAPSVDQFKVVSDDEPSDPMSIAYADLKTQSAVSNPSDLV